MDTTIIKRIRDAIHEASEEFTRRQDRILDEAIAAAFPEKPKTQKVSLRDPKSVENTCDCFKNCNRCGKKPAGWFALDGWPDAIMLCAECERGACAHETNDDAKHLRAVKILNRWARNGRTWYSGQVEVVGPQGEYRVAISDEPTDFSEFYYADTPEAAQIAAADELANEDPSLLEGLE